MTQPDWKTVRAEIEQRLAAATPGPWFDIEHPRFKGANHRIATKADGDWDSFANIATAARNDAPLIAHAPEDLRSLLTHIDEVEAENERLRSENYQDLLNQMDEAWGVNFQEVGGPEIRSFLESRIVHKPTTSLRAELALREQRISELERRLRIPFGKLPCAQCGGPHDFDTSIPSVVWNEVIRAKSLPEYLCTTCIVREFVRAGRSFTAELWNEEFNGVMIEVIVNGQTAADASLINEENNRLRVELTAAREANEEVAVERAFVELREFFPGRRLHAQRATNTWWWPIDHPKPSHQQVGRWSFSLYVERESSDYGAVGHLLRIAEGNTIEEAMTMAREFAALEAGSLSSK